jgi:hypothetical protein
MKSMLLFVVFAVACGGARRDTETLTESIREYNEGVRWERFAVAAALLPPAERGRFVDEMDQRTKELRITDYEIVRVDAKSRKEAKVQIKVSWYRDTEGTLKETHAVQTWELHGKQWWMVDETRLRGHEMPGLTEPAIDPAGEPADTAPAASASGIEAAPATAPAMGPTGAHL